MKFTSVKITNFKNISDVTLDLTDFNVIVGTNGSGKSSVLQAIHWVLQSGRNRSVTTNRFAKNGSTLSINDANYIPSPDYRNASNGDPYGNFQTAPKMEVQLKTMNEDREEQTADIWIKAARNEGLSVHIPSNNSITSIIRDTNREISAYIPGLAGIPLEEEKKSKRIVHRQAAAGDANTVLRNFLLLLKESQGKPELGGTLLDEVENWVSRILGKLHLDVNFNDENDYSINASFQTDKMANDGQSAKPLELAGIGFLQVIQIFAYLVYFRPRFLLVDEPDSHLHPDKQEILTHTLFEAAMSNDCQVIMTTHSPSVIRALPFEAKLNWVNYGKLEKDSADARLQMGWGLLDKKILLLTEDETPHLLQRILKQWPEIYRKVAVWPLRGLTTLPSPGSLKSMAELFGDKLQLVLHRDGDFITEKERSLWAKPYNDSGIGTWITEFSDIEAYFCNENVIAATLQIEIEDARILRQQALDQILDFQKTFSQKRKEINKNEKIYPGGAGTPTDQQVMQELCEVDAIGTYVGKSVLKKIRSLVQENNIVQHNKLGSYLPPHHTVAEDLKLALKKTLSKK